jgi:hypothetical protein
MSGLPPCNLLLLILLLLLQARHQPACCYTYTAGMGGWVVLLPLMLLLPQAHYC